MQNPLVTPLGRGDERVHLTGVGSIQLRCGCRYEAIATADGRYFQVQAGMPGMAALIDQNDIRLLAAEDADQCVVLRVRFAEVAAKTTLSVVY